MIKKLEGILRLAILCLGVYLVYTLYRPQADRLIREVKEQVFTTTENPAALLTEERQEETEAQKTLSFPARYDSRDYGRAPDVRNQGSLGTCWAVAAVSSLEASLTSRSTFVFGGSSSVAGTVMRKARMTAGLHDDDGLPLTAWKGPVLAEEDPYGRLLAGRLKSQEACVQEIQILRDRAAIKEAVQGHGAVQTPLYMDVQSDYSSVYYNERIVYC